MRLLGLTEMKTRAGITGSGDDDLLVSLLDGVSARMEAYCGRVWTQAVVGGVGDDDPAAERVRPIGRFAWVDRYPIDTTDDLTVTEWEGTAIPEDDYLVDPKTGLVELIWREYLYPHFSSVTVTYTGGYAVMGSGAEACLAVPDDLKTACAQQVKYEFQNRDQLGAASVSMQGTSVATRADSMWLAQVEPVLRSYRRWLLG